MPHIVRCPCHGLMQFVWPKLGGVRLEEPKGGSLKVAVDLPIEDSDQKMMLGGSVRALIIDDSAVMRKVIERALRQAGLEIMEVLQASNGEEALQTLRDDQGVRLHWR